MIRELLALGDMRGKLLFEMRPDIFGNFVSITELELWGLFYEERAARRGK